jgi:peptidyl-prolyl cis-trans isomerase C
MRRVAFFALFCLGFLLSACSGGGETATSTDGVCEWPPQPSVDQIGEALGDVDGMPFGTKEFDTMAARQVGRDGTLAPEVRGEIVDQLVDEKLLYMEARRRGIDKDPKIQKMMVNTLLKQEVYGAVRTSEIRESELREYFEVHKEDFVVPAKVQIKRILVTTQEGEDAAATRQRADDVRQGVMANPADFKSLAQRHSKGPYARRGGDMGFVTHEGKPGVDPKVVEQAFALPADQDVSDIFETDDGLNIVYVPNRRERVERPFEAMRGSVLRKVKSDKYRQLYDDYVAGLRTGAQIELDQGMIDSHDVRSVRGLDPAAAGSRRPAQGPQGGPAPVDAPPVPEDEVETD